MSYKNSNPAEQVARNEMEVATARVMNQMGFSHGSRSTVDMLSDLAVRYLNKMCSNVRLVSDNSGRDCAVLADVEYAYRRMSVDVDEMNDFLRQNLPLQPRILPRFPATPPKKERSVAIIAPTEEKPEYFPSWAPPIYSTGLTTVASSISTSIRGKAEAFPDFFGCSAMSLGISRNPERPQPVIQKTLSRPNSSASFYKSISRTNSRQDLIGGRDSVDSRPGSSCSTASGPMFKRRKRRLEHHAQPSTSAAAVGPSSITDNIASTSQETLPTVPEGQSMLFLAKDLAIDHRPVMNAVHSGRAAPPVNPFPLPTTRFSHHQLDKGYDEKNLTELQWTPGKVAPVEVMQFAIMRHLFVNGTNLADEIRSAFDFINSTPTEPAPEKRLRLPEPEVRLPAPEEPLHPTIPPWAPTPAPVPLPVPPIAKSPLPPPPLVATPLPAPPAPVPVVDTTVNYRIVPVDTVPNANTPAGVLPPLKIKISRNSISTAPSPAVSLVTVDRTPSSGSDGSPKAKRHKHKKKKKHKKKRETEECHIVQPSQEGGLRLKIRFKSSETAQ